MTSDTHRILITTEALSSLRGIASYINEQSPQNSTLVIDRILNGIDSLGSMPERFKRVGTSRKYGRPIHVLVIRPLFTTGWIIHLRRSTSSTSDMAAAGSRPGFAEMVPRIGQDLVIPDAGASSKLEHPLAKLSCVSILNRPGA